jgi:SAM-dependent methyltransferase
MPADEFGVRAEMRRILASCREGALPPNVALMQLAMAADSESSFLATVGAALDELEDECASSAEPLAELRSLAGASPDLWRLVQSVISSLPAETETHRNLDATLSSWAAAFDRAVAVSPEASVALYALGRSDVLDAATREVVDDMDRSGLLGKGRKLLDIGCGVGRFELALAGKVERIKGIDISPAMIEAARLRCVGFANVDFALYSGKNLGWLADGSFSTTLAIDSFPYVVAASTFLAAQLFREVARVLERGGDFYLVNYSYGSDLAIEAMEVEGLARESGFHALRSGDRPFRHWDGRVFHLSKA